MIAVILARAGSIRLPNKNTSCLCNGKPLITYVLETAIRSKYIDDIIISSESNFVKNLINGYRRKYSLSVRLWFDRRPKHLRGDNISSQECLDDIRKRYKRLIKDDGIVLLQLSNPLMRTEQIDDCIEMFKTGKYQAVVSVKFLAPFKIFIPNGSIFISKEKIWGEPIGLYCMPQEDSADIDTPLDLEIVEMIMRKRNDVRNC